MNGVLLDTSFLITFSTPARQHHAAAVSYFQAFIAKNVPMFLSTVVVSEFQVRQSVASLGLNNFLIVPFNIDHAIAAASFVDSAMSAREEDEDRVRLKDDLKLIGQCEAQGIGHFITADDQSLKSLRNLRKAFPHRALPMGIQLRDGFDFAWFNPGGQPGLDLKPREGA